MPELKAIVSGMYQAFGRGDVAAILEQCSPDVRWEDWPTEAPNFAQQAGVPFMKARRGKEGVAEFFQTLAAYQFKRFDVLNVFESGNQVAGLVQLEMVWPNGKTLREVEMHLFEFDAAGKVIRFRHYIDTAKALEAMRA